MGKGLKSLRVRADYASYITLVSLATFLLLTVNAFVAWAFALSLVTLPLINAFSSRRWFAVQASCSKSNDQLTLRGKPRRGFLSSLFKTKRSEQYKERIPELDHLPLREGAPEVPDSGESHVANFSMGIPSNTLEDECSRNRTSQEDGATLVSQTPIGPRVSRGSSQDFGIVTAVSQLRSFDVTRTLSEADKLARTDSLNDGLEYAHDRLPHGYLHTLDALRLNHAARSHDWVAWGNSLNRLFDSAETPHINLLPGESDNVWNLLPLHRSTEEVDGPLISVIMAARNAEATIVSSIKSIQNQTWRNLELLIVDDCSTDSTWSLLLDAGKKDERIRLLRNKAPVGPYVSRNVALDYARGGFITAHDADDWSHPNRLDMHMKAISSDSLSPPVSLQSMLRLNESGEIAFFSKVSRYSRDSVSRLASVSAMFNADALRSVGYWDSVRAGGDSEMIARVAMRSGGKYPHFQQIGMLCRQISTGLTSHPQWGLDGQGKQLRATYTRAFTKWHASTSQKNLFVPAVPSTRKFQAPPNLQVESASILRNIQVRTPETAPEAIGVVCVSKRPAQLEFVAESLSQSSYPELEVVFVAHGPGHDPQAIEKAFSNFPRFTLLALDSPDSMLADCLNLGLERLASDVVAKIDDDDYYLPPYLENSYATLQHHKELGVGLVGKQQIFAYIESLDIFGVRRQGRNQQVKQVAGSTLFWRRSLVGDPRFSRTPVGTDVDFQARIFDNGVGIFAGDPFDYVARRWTNVDDHTWKLPHHEFMNSLAVLCRGLRLDLASSDVSRDLSDFPLSQVPKRHSI